MSERDTVLLFCLSCKWPCDYLVWFSCQTFSSHIFGRNLFTSSRKWLNSSLSWAKKKRSGIRTSIGHRSLEIKKLRSSYVLGSVGHLICRCTWWTLTLTDVLLKQLPLIQNCSIMFIKEIWGVRNSSKTCRTKTRSHSSEVEPICTLGTRPILLYVYLWRTQEPLWMGFGDSSHHFALWISPLLLWLVEEV